MTATSIAVFSAQEEYEAALQRGGAVELLVTDSGVFQAKVTQISLPRTYLLRGEEWLPRIAVVSVSPGSLLVILPTEDVSRQTWGGVAMQADEILTFGPNERLRVRSTQRCRWGIICISARTIERYGHAVLGSGFSCPPGVHRWRPSRADLQSLTRLFNSAVRLIEAQPGRAAKAPAAHGLEQELIQALINCLRGDPLPTGIPAQHRHATTMDRLEDVLNAFPDRIPRVAQVCTALGVSKGALLACCKEQVGISPGRYFRLSRMRRVHRALVGSHLGSASVSDVAMSNGFKDLGRFASDYRKLFGELPSATLRKGDAAIHLSRT